MLKEVENSRLGTLRDGRVYELGRTMAVALVDSGVADYAEPVVTEEIAPKQLARSERSTSASPLGQASQQKTAKPSKFGGTIKLKRRARLL